MTTTPAPWIPGVPIPAEPGTDLQAALDVFFDAALQWATAYIPNLLGMTADPELAAAADRMYRAGAVVEWELGKTLRAASCTADYDDETITAMLRGAR